VQHQHRRVLRAFLVVDLHHSRHPMCPTARSRSPETATLPTSSRAPATISRHVIIANFVFLATNDVEKLMQKCHNETLLHIMARM
jgi:hypothetical protein